jgi:hypothetical protein
VRGVLRLANTSAREALPGRLITMHEQWVEDGGEASNSNSVWGGWEMLQAVKGCGESGPDVVRWQVGQLTCCLSAAPRPAHLGPTRRRASPPSTTDQTDQANRLLPRSRLRLDGSCRIMIPCRVRHSRLRGHGQAAGRSKAAHRSFVRR